MTRKANLVTKDAHAREHQKRANALANEMMRAEGLDPVAQQKLRVQYYMRAREKILLDDLGAMNSSKLRPNNSQTS